MSVVDVGRKAAADMTPWQSLNSGISRQILRHIKQVEKNNIADFGM